MLTHSRIFPTLILVLFFVQPSLSAESGTRAATELAKSIDYVRKNPGHAMPEDNLKGLDPKEILEATDAYKTDPSREIQSSLERLHYRLAAESSDQKIRQQAVEKLSATCRRTKAIHDWQPTARLIQRFNSADFTEAASKELLNCWSAHPEEGELAMALGVTQSKDALPALKKHSGGQILLARARLGDPEARSLVLKKVMETKDVLQKITGLRELAFTRSPEGIRYLVQLLDDSKVVPDSKGFGRGTPLSLYVVDALASAIEQFPIPPHYGVIRSEKELGIAKNWLRGHPEYRIAR